VLHNANKTGWPRCISPKRGGKLLVSHRSTFGVLFGIYPSRQPAQFKRDTETHFALATALTREGTLPRRIGLHWHVGHTRGTGFFDHEKAAEIAMKTKIEGKWERGGRARGQSPFSIIIGDPALRKLASLRNSRNRLPREPNYDSPSSSRWLSDNRCGAGEQLESWDAWN
jgi:hypothetical protein